MDGDFYDGYSVSHDAHFPVPAWEAAETDDEAGSDIDPLTLNYQGTNVRVSF